MAAGWLVAMDDPAFANRRMDTAQHRGLIKRSVLRLRKRLRCSESPFDCRIEENNVRIVPHCQTAAILEADDLCGVVAHQGDDVGHGQTVFAMENTQRKSQRRLDAGDAVWSALELDFLLVGRVGGRGRWRCSRRCRPEWPRSRRGNRLRRGAAGSSWRSCCSLRELHQSA